jgi:uncharacterized membrane protein
VTLIEALRWLHVVGAAVLLGTGSGWHVVGWRLTDGWLVVSMGLYVLTGLCWLPVVWIQIRLRELARQAEREATPLSEEYHRLFARWFALGIPAFVSVLAIVWLMVAKPQFRLFA